MRKNLKIDQAKLDRVKHALGADTETEAVDQALTLVLLGEDLCEGVRRIAGSGGVENVFENDQEPEARSTMGSPRSARQDPGG